MTDLLKSATWANGIGKLDGLHNPRNAPNPTRAANCCTKYTPVRHLPVTTVGVALTESLTAVRDAWTHPLTPPRWDARTQWWPTGRPVAIRRRFAR